jgi:hypothetical protein
MMQTSEWRFIWCAIVAATFSAIFVSAAAEPSEQSKATRIEDYPDYLSLERRFDEVYQAALASADQQQRAILEDEHARWFLEREKLRNEPDTYIAYTQQEIRYFAGSYDEPSGVLTFNDLSADEQALYDQGAIMEMYEPNEPSRHYIDPVGISPVEHKTKHDSNIEKNLPTEPILIFVFGKEDASAARSEGLSMAEFHYNRAMANQFLFAQGWDKYHYRFFTRAYLEEGMGAYEKALKK